MYRYIIKLFIIIFTALPVYLLVRRPWRRAGIREWAVGAFVLYMAGLLVLVLEGQYGNPVQMVHKAAGRISTGEGINLVPLRTIRTFFIHFIPDVFLVNIVGNLVMFVPWGFGLPLLWKRMRFLPSLVPALLVLPLGIETCQLFIDRSVDIDDLILNFLGGCLGAGAYCGLRGLAGCREWFVGMEQEAREVGETASHSEGDTGKGIQGQDNTGK